MAFDGIGSILKKNPLRIQERLEDGQRRNETIVNSDKTINIVKWKNVNAYLRCNMKCFVFFVSKLYYFHT